MNLSFGATDNTLQLLAALEVAVVVFPRSNLPAARTRGTPLVGAGFDQPFGVELEMGSCHRGHHLLSSPRCVQRSVGRENVHAVVAQARTPIANLLKVLLNAQRLPIGDRHRHQPA